jgi:hypothetical protein
MMPCSGRVVHAILALAAVTAVKTAAAEEAWIDAAVI